MDRNDDCIRNKNDESLTLKLLAQEFGYSEFHFSRKFKEISGMQFRDYLRCRRLAFALKELRDTEKRVLQIALDHGFSSHEAFTRAFREAYGLTPSEYRKHPVPVALRTILRPFDCYLLENGGTDIQKTQNKVKTYFVTIPAHKFLHIKNYEVLAIGISGKSRVVSPGRTAKRSAACWTVFLISWMIWAAGKQTAAVGRSWHL